MTIMGMTIEHIITELIIHGVIIYFSYKIGYRQGFKDGIGEMITKEEDAHTELTPEGTRK